MRVLVAAGVACAIVAVGLVADQDPPPESAVERSPLTPTGPVPTPIRMTPAIRREVDAVIERFVRTAVVRRDPGSAWSIASPNLRAGSTLGDWRRGDLPAHPYPASALRAIDWRVVYREPDRLGVDVMLVPKARSSAAVSVSTAELTPIGRGADRRWLVDSWAPVATLGTGAPAAPARTETSVAAPDLAYDEGKLSPRWLLVPASLGLVLVLTLGAFALRASLRARRAERLYRAHARR